MGTNLISMRLRRVLRAGARPVKIKWWNPFDWIFMLLFRAHRVLQEMDNEFYYKGKRYSVGRSRVESLDEKRIAVFLHERGIAFQYEPLLILFDRPPKGFLNRQKLRFLFWLLHWFMPDFMMRALFRGIHGYRPDFYIPIYKVYMEYWGLVRCLDLKKRAHYIRVMRKKKELYARNGIRLISLYPDSLKELEPLFEEMIRKLTGKRPRFRKPD